MKFFDVQLATTDRGSVSPLILLVLALLMIGMALAGQTAMAMRNTRYLVELISHEEQALRTIEAVAAALRSSSGPAVHSRFGPPFVPAIALTGSDSLQIRDLSAEAWNKQLIGGPAQHRLRGFVHPALADENALRTALGLRLRDSSSLESAVSTLQAWRAGGADPRTYQTLLEVTGTELWPVLAPLAPVNVNLAERQTLMQVCDALWSGGPAQAAFLRDLESKRQAGLLDVPALQALLQLHDAPSGMALALGTRTWFWELQLEQAGQRWKAVLCELPDRQSGVGLENDTVGRRIIMLSLRKEG